jgi:hypothetical protein
MNKRDNPLVLVLILAFVFGLSMAGILWANKFDSRLNSVVGNDSENPIAESTGN